MKCKYGLICEHCGRFLKKPKCIRTQTKMVLCDKHYNQMIEYGKFLDNIQRCKKDDNEILILDGYAEVLLYNLRGEEVARAKIDLDCIDLIKSDHWYLTSANYMMGKEKGLFHKLLINSKIVDHINRDTLDNRKDNLRGATSSQNQINRSKQRNNKSGVTGVYYCNTKKKWKAILEKEGAILIRKYFDNKEDAIKCRLNGEKKYFGEYAPQKHLFEQYGID